jgi:Fe-S cluster assembly protein SufB
MSSTNDIGELASREHKYGFVTEIEADTVPPGLDPNIIRLISSKKDEPDFMLEWRLKAFRHWQTMQEPKCKRYSLTDPCRALFYDHHRIQHSESTAHIL